LAFRAVWKREAAVPANSDQMLLCAGWFFVDVILVAEGLVAKERIFGEVGI